MGYYAQWMIKNFLCLILNLMMYGLVRLTSQNLFGEIQKQLARYYCYVTRTVQDAPQLAPAHEQTRTRCRSSTESSLTSGTSSESSIAFVGSGVAGAGVGSLSLPSPSSPTSQASPNVTPSTA